MKKLICINIRKFHWSIPLSSLPLVIGPIKDNYLPTNFSKKEKTITVFGSTGFLGERVVHELVQHRCQLILPYRGDVHDCKHVRMIGGVGQNLFMPFSVLDENSIEKAILFSDGVINLIGNDFQNSHFSFNELHVEIASKIARIAKRVGVESYVHVSALGATVNPVSHLLPSGSQFLRSKWLGEQEVRKEFPEAVIIRPSNIWGFNDRFIYFYLNKKRRLLGSKIVIPMWKCGEKTVKQPVYVDDVAKSIGAVLFNDPCKGWLVEVAGPERFQLNHLVQWFYLHNKYKLEDVNIVEMSEWFLWKARFRHRFTAMVPHVTEEDLERECVTDLLTGCRTLADLGIRPSKFEDRIHWLLKPYHCVGYRWDNLGPFDPPPVPPLAID